MKKVEHHGQRAQGVCQALRQAGLLRRCRRDIHMPRGQCHYYYIIITVTNTAASSITKM